MNHLPGASRIFLTRLLILTLTLVITPIAVVLTRPDSAAKAARPEAPAVNNILYMPFVTKANDSSNNISGAWIIYNGETLTGRVDDYDQDDVYKLYAYTGQDLLIILDGVGGDADLYLYPPTSTDINDLDYVESSTGFDSYETIEYTAYMNGYWYIDIYDYDDDGEGTNYSIYASAY